MQSINKAVSEIKNNFYEMIHYLQLLGCGYYHPRLPPLPPLPPHPGKARCLPPRFLTPEEDLPLHFHPDPEPLVFPPATGWSTLPSSQPATFSFAAPRRRLALCCCCCGIVTTDSALLLLCADPDPVALAESVGSTDSAVSLITVARFL